MWNLLLDGVEIPASGSVISEAIHLFDRMEDHAFEYAVSGSGTVRFTVYTSISGRHYISNGIKANGITASSGPGSDGHDVIPLSLKPGDLLKIAVEETGGADVATVSLWFTQK